MYILTCSKSTLNSSTDDLKCRTYFQDMYMQAVRNMKIKVFFTLYDSHSTNYTSDIIICNLHNPDTRCVFADWLLWKSVNKLWWNLSYFNHGTSKSRGNLSVIQLTKRSARPKLICTWLEYCVQISAYSRSFNLNKV